MYIHGFDFLILHSAPYMVHRITLKQKKKKKQNLSFHLQNSISDAGKSPVKYPWGKSPR